MFILIRSRPRKQNRFSSKYSVQNNTSKPVLKVQFVEEFSMFVAQMTFDLFNLRASAAGMTTAAAAGYSQEMSCRAFAVDAVEGR